MTLDDNTTTGKLIEIPKRGIATWLMSVGIFTATLSGCVGTGGGKVVEPVSELPWTEQITSVKPVSVVDEENFEKLTARPVDDENCEQMTARAAEAYGHGDLDGAETLFKTLRQRNPNDPRAVYNLAMLNLQRAYDGLRSYVVLETVNRKKQQAVELLQHLSDVKQ